MGEVQKFNNTVLTDMGYQMLTSIASGDRKITYTKAEAYAQDVSSIPNEVLQGLTSLQGKQLSANLRVSNDNDNVVTITANFENKDLTSDAVFSSIGWFARLDADDAEQGITAKQEYLIGITPANSAQTLVTPPADRRASQAIILNLNMTLSDAAKVDMTVNDAGTVHFNQLDDQLAGYTLTSDLNKLLARKADLGLSYTKAELDAKLLYLSADTSGKVGADQVKALINGKANISEVYTKSQIDSNFSTRDAQINNATSLAKKAQETANTKADASNVYTKSQIDKDFSARDTQINTKANTSNVYTKSQIDSDFSTRDAQINNATSLAKQAQETANTKADASNVYTKQQTDGKLESLKGQATAYTDATVGKKFNAFNNQLAGYTPRSDLNKLLARKADLGLSYTKAELDAKLLGLSADTSGKVDVDQVKALINDKANISEVYTKNQIDSDFSTRDAQINNATNLAKQAQETANTKADASNVYTKQQTDGKLEQKITFVKCDSPQAAADASSKPADDGSIVIGIYDMNDGPSQAVVGDQKIDIEWLYNHLNDLQSTVNSGLAAKANQSDVNSGLDTKANQSDLDSTNSTVQSQANDIASLKAKLNDAVSQINYIKANYIEGQSFAKSQEAQATAWENANPQRIAFITDE